MVKNSTTSYLMVLAKSYYARSTRGTVPAKSYYARSTRDQRKATTRAVRAVASYWLIDDFTSMTRTAGTALKLYELVLSARPVPL